MNLIKPASFVNHVVKVPCSKSHAQRAIALALCTKGTSIIKDLSDCEDIAAAISIVKSCGASIQWKNKDLIISSSGINLKPNQVINCKESGFLCRMFTSLLAIQKKPFEINGTGSLLQREMHFFEQHYPVLKTQIKTNKNKLPFKVKGPIIPIDIELDASSSSQYISGLIFAYASQNISGLKIHLKNPVSIGYIDLSIQVANLFGANIQRNECTIFFGKGDLKPTDITIDGDWSAGAFWLVAGAIYGKMNVFGLNVDSMQADKQILVALKQFGASMDIHKEHIMFQKKETKAIEFDATNCPDLFPPLAVLCSKSDGISKIHGIERLYNKESNRCQTLISEFKKFGIHLWTEKNTMFIEGNPQIKTPKQVINSHNDHRISMAASILGIGCNEGIEIDDYNCVNKSYSSFYEDLSKLYI